MKALIVEDDITSQLLLREQLRSLGPTHVAANGNEAINAVRTALEHNDPYDLICLDILMPEMDGQHALKELRTLEQQRGLQPGHGAKIVMTSVLRDKDHVLQAFREQCDGYLVKPVDKKSLLNCLRELELIESGPTQPDAAAAALGRFRS